VKRWLDRSTLAGYALGPRRFVTAESVERVVGPRDSLRGLDREDNSNLADARTLRASATIERAR
jgi:hypothetical protein